MRFVVLTLVLGLFAPLYSVGVSHADTCDSHHEICVGETVVGDRRGADGEIQEGKVLAANADGTFDVALKSGTSKIKGQFLGIADPGVCSKDSSFCVNDTVEFTGDKSQGQVVAIFPSGLVGVEYADKKPSFFSEKPNVLKIVSHKSLSWVLNADNSKVLGCMEKDSANPAYLKTLATDDCSKKLPTKITWNESDRACRQVTSSGAWLADKSPQDCLAQHGVRYFWIDSAAGKCGGFDHENSFIDYVDAKQCAGADLVCMKATGVLTSVATTEIDGVLYHLVPEILSLRDGQVVPPDVYKKYSPDLIAATIVQRIHEKDEADANAANPAYDYQSNAMIQMRFNDRFISDIAKDGFLNQHQIGHTNGSTDTNSRAQTENQLARLRLESAYLRGDDNPVNAIRPKYSFLTFRAAAAANQHPDHLNDQYGNVVAVFKDEVKNRATFTADDSLDVYMSNSGRVQDYSFKYRSDKPIQKAASEGNDYWEAQIWGDLSFADVSYFLVSCSGEGALSDDSFAKLKAIGLPIYKCIVPAEHSHFEKGPVLYAGDPLIAPKPRQQSGTDSKKLLAH